MLGDKREWFAPQAYGIGAGLPISWRGWAMLGVFLAVVLATGLAFQDRPIVLIAIVIPLTAVFLLIAARTTRGGWRWRWGDEG